MIVLEGGGAFVAHDVLDRQMLERCGASSVVVLPTADAMETPRALVEAAESWVGRIGTSVSVEAAMVLQRAEATDEAAARLADADAVWVVGDSSLHLRSVIKDTPIMEVLQAKALDGLVVGVGASAAALCDPMTDPRGGAFTLGLGLVSGLALVTELEAWSHDQLQRTRELAVELGDACLALLPSDAALVSDDAWEAFGEVELVGELPPVVSVR